MSRLKTTRSWVILGLIFILGAITGSLLTIGFGPRFLPHRPGPAELRNHWMTHLSRHLHLTDVQRNQIQPIVFAAEAEIESAHHEDVVRISSIMQAANAKISGFLNPDQQKDLREMERDRERMFMPGHQVSPGPGSPHPEEGEGSPPPNGGTSPPDEPPPPHP